MNIFLCASSKGRAAGTVAVMAFVGMMRCEVASGQVTLSYRVQQQLSLHEPGVLEISFDNRLPQPIILDLGRNYVGEFRLAMRQPDGKTVTADTLRPKGPDQGGYIMARITVPTGKEYVRRVVLNQWFRFDQLGEYRFDVQFVGAARSESGTDVQLLRTASLGLRVTHRDEQALRGFCQRWLEELERSQTADAAMVAADALYTVDDPVAIDYITVAIKTNVGLSADGFRALERIGTAEVVWALQKLAQDSHEYVRETAKQTLARLQARRKHG